VPPQLDALSKNTQLVTMTIGGNDNNVFIDTIFDCGSAGLSTGARAVPARTATAPHSTTPSATRPTRRSSTP
jgi:hypothetical protein